ncbi:MAG TPA: hypothetical protein P5119_02805 [Candidatus Aminicenantes bacterium]|nr:hypothetical protein [Candidatus Aminicenantes bacterium]HRY64253.1 hypothetical protein [Candidatus Aminicenantes bacterium]HRZ71166.1 hypothetical protein [Candidatus Aminicenantes bacterium]
MTKTRIALILLVPAFLAARTPAPAAAEEVKKPAFGLALSGFVKTDIFYDSRQTTSIREGHYLLFPKGPAIGPDGADANARGAFNILSVQTRLAGTITGPDALGARTSAYIEAEFFGTSDSDLNGFRLRHGYLKLDWARSELLIGQFWHPMFVTESFPDVVSFNTGAPFQPFNRSPQVRFTRKFGRVSLSATALAQRDFLSNGPDGTSSVYLRNSALPEFNLKLQYGTKNAARKTETVAGLGADVLRLAPRIVTALGYPTDESLTGLAAMAFVKLKWPKWSWKAEAVWGQNLHHLTMLGGYAVRGVVDEARGDWSYTPIATLSLWTEVQTTGAPWQTGLFAGYARNLGSPHEIGGADFARGFNIGELYRLSPRLVYNAGKMRFAGEVELTAASYGAPDPFGKVRDARFVRNLRLLLAAYYFF